MKPFQNGGKFSNNNEGTLQMSMKKENFEKNVEDT